MTEAAAQISSSIDSLMREFNIITHNLANVSTVGYKRICNNFSKSLQAQQSATGADNSGGVDLNSALDFSQGSIVETGRPLDFALLGKGFFVVETPDGPIYTRNGIFHINQNGQIVSSDGNIVAGQAGLITIPADAGLSELYVTADGSISAGGTVIDKLKLVDFKDKENMLVPIGANCYALSATSSNGENIEPGTAGNIVVKQGYQETSNVQMVDELVDMIMVSRLYEANMQILSSQKDTSSSIIGVAMG